MWVIELYLNQLGQLKEQDEEGSQKYESLQESFHKFLQAPRVKVSHVLFSNFFFLLWWFALMINNNII
jgi:hypothetical protein